MKYGSLFSGIGAIDLGLERSGWECRWMVEIDPKCRAVLDARWPEVTKYVDVSSLRGTMVEHVDALVGGYPCQDNSHAHTNGVRRNLDGEKSGLWWEFSRLVAELEPRWVIVENVPPWQDWVPEVRADLAGHGYASVCVELSAGSFGAPDKRPRHVVVAHANGEGQPLRAIDAEVARLSPLPRGGRDWRSPPAGGFRMAPGSPSGMDRNRMIGNSACPIVFEWLARAISGVSATRKGETDGSD